MSTLGRHGPRRPTRESGTLSSARARVLREVAALGGEAVTLRSVAERLGGHLNSSRQHLDFLVRDGYLLAVDLAPKGPGRRPRGHSLTPRGRRELTPPQSTELVEVFAAYLVAEGGGRAEARAIGEAWAERHPPAPDHRHNDAVDAVVEVLDILGFDPERSRTTAGETVVLRACPLLDAAKAQPDVICQVHQGLIDGILARVGALEGLDLQPFADPRGCRLEPRPGGAPTTNS